MVRLLRGSRGYLFRGALLLLPPPAIEYKASSDEVGVVKYVLRPFSSLFIFSSFHSVTQFRDRHYKTAAALKFGSVTSIDIMCTLKKQCYACIGGCVEQVVIHCPSYLAGRDCGQSDASRAGQQGGMLLQEILHLSPCPKHGIDNPHDQCKATRGFLMYEASGNNTNYLSGNLSLSSIRPRVKVPSPPRTDVEGECGAGSCCVRMITMIGTW